MIKTLGVNRRPSSEPHFTPLLEPIYASTRACSAHTEGNHVSGNVTGDLSFLRSEHIPEHLHFFFFHLLLPFFFFQRQVDHESNSNYTRTAKETFSSVSTNNTNPSSEPQF